MILPEGYEFEEIIGSGGFGTVVGARETATGDAVAIKIIPIIDNRTPRDIIQRECEILRGLTHANIVKYRNTKIDDIANTVYLVMDRVHGTGLAKWIVGKNLQALFGVLDGISDAVDYTHGHGIVHRDIKPDNILVVEFPNQTPKGILIDFGIAKPIAPGQLDLTSAGMLKGTVDYFPPEVLKGQRATEPSDQYSLALILYQFDETFSPPALFQQKGENLHSFLHRRISADDVVIMRATEASRVRRSLRKALSPQPSKRFGSCNELIRSARAEHQEFTTNLQAVLPGLVRKLEQWPPAVLENFYTSSRLLSFGPPILVFASSTLMTAGNSFGLEYPYHHSLSLVLLTITLLWSLATTTSLVIYVTLSQRAAIFLITLASSTIVTMTFFASDWLSANPGFPCALVIVSVAGLILDGTARPGPQIHRHANHYAVLTCMALLFAFSLGWILISTTNHMPDTSKVNLTVGAVMIALAISRRSKTRIQLAVQHLLRTVFSTKAKGHSGNT